MDVDNSADSIWLYDVLEKIGISEKLRRTLQNGGMLYEILHTDIPAKLITVYNVGSSCEGTITPDASYDVDVMSCHDQFPIIDRMTNLPPHQRLHLMVRDPDTAPGYVKLQLVYNWQPLFEKYWHIIPPEYRDLYTTDRFGRLVWKSFYEIWSEEIFRSVYPGNVVRCGPAYTQQLRNNMSYDYVVSVRSKLWPIVAQEWLLRDRKYDWPSKDKIRQLESYGCFLVWKGHPRSKEINLECRISFSLQEREIMFSLSDIQYKCYVLLKLINRDIVKAENEQSLSSYHWKTCLFYTIEENPQDIWQPGKLLKCVMKCITLMLKWVINGNCPNYFIPSENMFDGRLDHRILCKVKTILRNILDERVTFLSKLKTENICKYFESKDDILRLHCLVMKSRSALSQTLAFAKILPVLHARKILEILIKQSEKSSLQNLALKSLGISYTIDFLWTHIRSIESGDIVSRHTKKETTQGRDLLLPFLYTCLAGNIASLAINCKNESVREILLAGSAAYFKRGCVSDCLSGRLKYISFLFSLGLFSKCDENLRMIDEQYSDYIVPLCQCRDLGGDGLRLSSDLRKQIENCDDVVQIMNIIFTCVIFLPTELAITPKALQFEMFRSYGVKSETEYIDEEWYGWAVVDSNIYRLFLNYIVAKQLCKPRHVVAVIIIQIMNLVEQRFIAHRETAYNLLSWIALSENFIPCTVQFLHRSRYEMTNLNLNYLTKKEKLVQGHHNSAKWHALFLVQKVWCERKTESPNDLSYCFQCFYFSPFRFKKCSRCKIATYCSVACQRKNWKNHRRLCNMTFPL